MHSLYSFITQDAYRAVSVCVRNLRWRFYLLLSRIACLLGWKQDAFKVGILIIIIIFILVIIIVTNY